MTKRPTMRLNALLVGVLSVAACGGGTSSAPPGGGAAPTVAPGATASAPPAAATPAASVAPTDAGTGGQGVGVCELATVDELGPLFGGSALISTVYAGPPDSCIVTDASGRTYASWSLSTTDAAAIFDAVNLPSQAVAVSGMGDRAAFVENMGLLVLKGDRLLTIAIAGGAELDQDASQEAARQIGALAVPRM